MHIVYARHNFVWKMTFNYYHEQNPKAFSLLWDHADEVVDAEGCVEGSLGTCVGSVLCHSRLNVPATIDGFIFLKLLQKGISII